MRSKEISDLRWALVLVAAFVLGLLVALGLLGEIAHRESDPKVFERDGVTYVDGVCYVDDDGVLWCSERG